MADVKISQLTAASQVQDTDVLPMTSGSSTVKVSALQLKNHAISGLDASDSAVAGSYVTAVSETDGVISVTREAADASPTNGSNKMVKSGGVYSALAGKQDSLTFDDSPTQSSTNPVKSGGVYTALAAKQDALTFDNTPTQNSNNPVKSGGVYDALQNAGGHTIKDDQTTYTQRKSLVFDGFYLEDDSTNDATIIRKNKPIPSWSSGSDADIIEALQMHYNGGIDLHDYWSVGDERTIHLSAMEATGVGEAHDAVDLTFVLMNAGGKTLSDGTTECAFVVGVKEALYPGGYMNSTNTNTGGWRDCARRTWCNSVFYNAISSTIKSIFKQFKNKSGTGGGSSSGTYDTTDYFALPAEIEVFGATTYSVAGEGAQFKYYETAANRIKLRTDTQAAGGWWERSPLSGYSNIFCNVNTSGSADFSNASAAIGLSPFGCI